MEPIQTRLPPSKVDCKWWKNGYCHRGSTCFFKHNPALIGVDAPKTESEPRGRGATKDTEGTPAKSDSTSQNSQRRKYCSVREPCGICLEKPEVYGLLTDCDHTFCLECIREWRSSGNKPPAAGIDRHLDPDMVETTKTCPVCRIKSQFVVPSSVVPVPPKRAPRSPNSGGGPPPNPAKEKIIETYLQQKKRIPCRYYQESVRTWKEAIEKKAAKSRPNDDDDNDKDNDDIPPEPSTVITVVFRPRCRFGNDCHYAHIHPETGKPHTFTEAELEHMDPRSRRGRSLYISDRLLDDSLALWEMFRDESARYVIDSANEERRQRELSPIAISEDFARSASDLDLHILSELEEWEDVTGYSDGTDLDAW